MNPSDFVPKTSQSAQPAPFFVTGGTLPLDAASYVARTADEELYQSLRRGEFCYVLNTRQMGKSSLMIRAARRLREEGRQVLILDLTGVGQNLSVEQWYFGLLDLAATQSGNEEELFAFWKTHKELGAMQRFVAALRRVLLNPQTPMQAVQDLVIFIDEIDAVRSLPFSADEFFAGIRECCNRNAQDADGGRLTFCLLGVATPSDLIRDTRVTPFNIGHRIELHDFTPEEAAPLAEGLRQHRDDSEAEALLERILYWTGGHPYMTQRLCRAVAERLHSNDGIGKRDEIEDAVLVDTLCQSLFLTKSARETDDNLAFVRTRLLHSEADKAALLDLYGQVRRGKRVRDDETNPLCPVLRLSGIVKAENGWLILRSEIYSRVFDAAWIAAHMPDAEIRRQKRAYRLGVLRTAAVGSIVVLVMAALAGYAWQQSKIAARNAERAIKNEQAASRSADAERSATTTARQETAAKNRALQNLQTQSVQLREAKNAAEDSAKRADAKAAEANQAAANLKTANDAVKDALARATTAKNDALHAQDNEHTAKIAALSDAERAAILAENKARHRRKFRQTGFSNAPIGFSMLPI